jgi:hypothetical protein
LLKQKLAQQFYSQHGAGTETAQKKRHSKGDGIRKIHAMASAVGQTSPLLLITGATGYKEIA